MAEIVGLSGGQLSACADKTTFARQYLPQSVNVSTPKQNIASVAAAWCTALGASH
jgi:hypothetical protein